MAPPPQAHHGFDFDAFAQRHQHAADKGDADVLDALPGSCATYWTRCVPRYGVPVVLMVDAARMHAQGFMFHQAENGVWLTARVPPAFLHRTR